MPRPRSTLISLEDTPYYHCCSRVVRRAFLCGDDKYTGKNYDHRRGWVEAQILKLTEVFAIDVAAYAVMSNHLHVVLYIDLDTVNGWSDREVVEQWHKLFNGTDLTQKFAKGEVIDECMVALLKQLIATYRSRLCDISWFMRCLNEPIARQANYEDNCTGHFWEGRFKSQALLDEAAVLACMAYVELNPIRAKMAKTPEKSDYTSLQLRVNAALKGKQPAKLLPFIGNERKYQPKGINFSLQDYLMLVDETGRVVRDDKRGAISSEAENILNRLNIPMDNWIKITSEFGQLFHGPVGSLQELTHYCEHLEKRRRHFASSCQYLSAS
ncbi:transposase [Shewanella fidelis]|uniref:Transposase n=1 Tax=Shewanella fidelis TaxID=173509 RepID=A0AAW8NKB7_9GAMM|nr:transposase [Shewanella fidelis]MDR8522656.1 transposase [Shewanella fidelis]MDW4812271.1 transposase [Shewanella fidelis]MDW4816064.1 transposase [Shewanella fidelis]MDW4820512.1 transposase [Shewanella fidelis]MDW4824735.1 transposase [Shewanella fidelis]